MKAQEMPQERQMQAEETVAAARNIDGHILPDWLWVLMLFTG